MEKYVKTQKEIMHLDISYLLLRKMIGFMGILLPFGCIIWAGKQLPSISHYYYTDANVLFTGTLVILGAFLMCNTGYPKEDDVRISDWTWNLLAGICIVIVAVVPTDFIDGMEPTPVMNYEGTFAPQLHFGAAALFFLIMGSVFCWRFTLTQRDAEGNRVKAEGKKKWKNWSYRICGMIILGVLCFAGLAILGESLKYWMLPQTFVFWVEIALLIPFAIAWFIKGDALEDIADGAKVIGQKLHVMQTEMSKTEKQG
jgi:hypothetical protein